MSDVEIGALGETKVYIKLDELFKIANKEVQDFADNVCEDNSKLQYRLDVALEALKFYAKEKHIRTGSFEYTNFKGVYWVNGNVEDGTKAREALKEIGDD